MIYCNVDGILKRVKSKYENVLGINKEVYTKYEMVNGVLKPVYNSKILRIPINGEYWSASGSPPVGSMTFNNETMTLKYGVVTCCWGINFYQLFNQGYKYIRFDYDTINLPNNAILCMGISPWSSKNQYIGAEGGWYYQNYMVTGSWLLQDLTNKTYTSNGRAYTAGGNRGMDNYERITFGINGTTSYVFVLKRVLVSKVKNDLLNL